MTVAPPSGPAPPAAATTPAAAGLRGDSAPLEPGVRDLLSAGFGHDFSPVRVHVGPDANAAARDLGALAYTVGNDVVFAAGAYDPLTRSGRSLIAHELAHVAQHGGRAYAPNFLRSDPAAPVAAADARLERQAHAAAHLHSSGVPLPGGWAWEHSRHPFVGRAGSVPSDWTTLAEGYTIQYASEPRVVDEEQWDPHAPAIARIKVGEFLVPGEKGPWQKHYDLLAKSGALEATIDLSGKKAKAGLWQKRSGTAERRRLWLARVGWTEKQALDSWWEEAGGAPFAGSGFVPRAGAEAAEIDHIVELQLGGTNVPENLVPHNESDNRSSGGEIWRGLESAANSAAAIITERKGGKGLRQLILSFSSARQVGTYPDTKPLAALPPPGPARDIRTQGPEGQGRQRPPGALHGPGRQGGGNPADRGRPQGRGGGAGTVDRLPPQQWPCHPDSAAPGEARRAGPDRELPDRREPRRA